MEEATYRVFELCSTWIASTTGVRMKVDPYLKIKIKHYSDLIYFAIYFYWCRHEVGGRTTFTCFRQLVDKCTGHTLGWIAASRCAGLRRIVWKFRNSALLHFDVGGAMSSPQWTNLTPSRRDSKEARGEYVSSLPHDSESDVWSKDVSDASKESVQFNLKSTWSRRRLGSCLVNNHESVKSSEARYTILQLISAWQENRVGIGYTYTYSHRGPLPCTLIQLWNGGIYPRRRCSVGPTPFPSPEYSHGVINAKDVTAEHVVVTNSLSICVSLSTVLT